MDKHLFIEKFGTLARMNYSKEKILPSLVIAQAILESGWGTSELSYKANNYFGLKWYNDEVCRPYKSVNYLTWEEYKVGEITNIDALFCAFDTIEECVECLYRWYNRSKYKQLHECTNYKDACRVVKECGYATDSQYTNKLIRIIEEWSLYEYDNFEDENDYYYFVQIGAYKDKDNAIEMQKNLYEQFGLDSSIEYGKKHDNI